MGVNRTLLERIRDPGRAGQRELRVPVNVVFDSILRNVQKILNTTQGNCLTDEKYGLPHLSSVRSAMPFSLGAYEACIRATVERHEPRLVGLRVRHSPSPDRPMELRFEISGMIQTEDGRQAMRFETVADDDGRLTVK